MQRQIVQRALGPGGCNFCGLYFTDTFVKGIDAGLIVCFIYMVILEASDYTKYKKEGNCTKPFGLFWIGHFTSIVMFRVFHYLEKYAHYRLLLVAIMRDITRVRSARLRVLAMRGCKLLSYYGFLIFTVIGSVWFVQDGRCLNQLDEKSSNHAEIKMAFWLFASFTICLIYAIKVLTRQIFENPPGVEVAQRNDNRQLFMEGRQLFREGRALTEIELSGMKKSKLSRFDELNRSARRPPSVLQQMPIQLSTVPSDEPTSENSEEVIEDPELKQDVVDSSQGICAVCLEDIQIGEWYKKLPQCEHCFHDKCIDQWLSTRATCPVCREEIFIDQSALERSVADGSILQAHHIPRGGNLPHIVIRFTRVVS